MTWTPDPRSDVARDDGASDVAADARVARGRADTGHPAPAGAEPAPPVRRLPPVQVLRCTLRARDQGRLMPLPTTSVHGALATAAREQCCALPERTTCRGCPRERECSYPRLLDPGPVRAVRVPPGAERDPPPPYALAPLLERRPIDGRPIPVRAGTPLPLRLALVGVAIADAERYLDFLARGARRGLACHDGGPRVRFDLMEVAEVPAPPPRPAGAVRVDLLTPLRIKAAGQVTGSLDAPVLVGALLRRAETLAALYGDAWPAPVDTADAASRLGVHGDVRQVHIPRRRNFGCPESMRWPGLVGALVLRGPGVGHLWPVLRFAEQAQLGGKTTFGYGLLRLVPLA